MTELLHILVIAASDTDAAPFLFELSAAGQTPYLVRVDNREALRMQLRSAAWDAVLYSDALEYFDLSAALQVVREQHANLPVIVISHTNGEASAVAALKAGAQNFVSTRQIARFGAVFQQELHESRERHALGQHDEQLRSVLAHAQCLLWSGMVIDVFDPTGMMQWETAVFDEAAAQRFAPIECLPGERYTSAWYRHRMDEDKQRTDQLSTTAFRNNYEQYTETFRCRLRDGSVRWFSEQVRVRPVSPCSWHVVGVAVDITERKQSEARLAFLAEASALLTQSLDVDTILGNLARLCVPFLADMCIVDIIEDDGSLRRVASHHIDPAKAELVRELERRFPLDPHGSHPAVRVIRTGEPVVAANVDPIEIANATYNAEHEAIVEQLAFKSYIVVPLAARGQVLGAILLVATEAPRSYGQIELALAQEIAHRATIAAENAKLYSHSQQAIQIREAFLSIAAHELRTPLTSLLGNAQVLERRGIRDGLFAERDQRNLVAIIAQGNRLNRLIELLLDVSRLQQDRLQLELSPVDFSTVVDRVVEEMQPSLREHNLECECEPGVLVLADELRLEQVLHNLLSNAVKYTPHGGPIALRLAHNGTAAHFVITDSGIGIPQHELPHLFTQFYRASNVDPKRFSGLGVGLYLVYEVITRHGGTVEVESVEGQGSTFTITLPILDRSRNGLS